MTSHPRASLERLLPLFALIYGALVFLPMTRNLFWADDFGWIERAMDSLGTTWSWLAPSKTDFRPLANLSFLLNLKVSGLSPFGYYLFNLFLHLTNVLLVMALVRRLAGGDRVAAAVAGMLFAGGFGHYGEAIVWICGRTGPLADLFTLGALISHWEWLERWRGRERILTVACFALALLAKESAVVLLPLLVMLEWAHGGREPKRSRLETLAGYFPIALMLTLYMVYQFGVLRAGSPILAGEYVLGWHAARNLLEYLVRMIVPVNSTSLLVSPPAAIRAVLQWFTLAMMAAVPLLWLILLLRPIPRTMKFAILWMPITLLPYIFFNFRTSTRYLYTPSIGLAALLGMACAAWWVRASSPDAHRRRRAGLLALATVLLLQVVVMQIVIRQRRAAEVAAGEGPMRELVEHAKAVGLR